MPQASHLQPEPTYLDMQALVGITKHIGGFEATDTLLALCHVEAAHEVLLGQPHCSSITSAQLRGILE